MGAGRSHGGIQPEALVALFVEEDVLSRVAADGMGLDLVGAPGFVRYRVDQVLSPGDKEGTGKDVLELFLQQLAGF